MGGHVLGQPWLNLEQAWVLVEEEVVGVGHLLLVEYCLYEALKAERMVQEAPAGLGGVA